MKVEQFNIRNKENFKKVCNKLLSVCFICKKKEDTKGDYYFIESNLEPLNEYLGLLDYEIELNKTIGVAQLINKNNSNKVNLKLIDSILLLILRILYHEKMEELSLTEDIMVQISEIQEKFIALEFQDKIIDKTKLLDSLRVLKRYNIIQNLDSNMTLGDSRIIIYPSILMALRMEDITKVYEKLNTYKRKEVKEDEEVNSHEAY
ncbi:hypothetical protein Z968_13010 [Clostridium novyi A str. 4552]|uniref:DUF4194 domain-containing protein n=1 Tax=Clostridium novyi A str. 4552 TaxID=1444289 RepID=A0A0A0HWV2_CLONO|nr:DUF4194 domain-containing protein [Clostridium novyi]KGM92848.1 hypothetical protein Z968_13010 [Clostridium novyi A str. 4552]